MTPRSHRKSPGADWSRFLLSRAAVGAALGAGGAALLVASPATGLLGLLAADDGVLAGPGLLALGFAGLSSAAFLATAFATGWGDGGPGSAVRRTPPVRVTVRPPPRRT